MKKNTKYCIELFKDKEKNTTKDIIDSMAEDFYYFIYYINEAYFENKEVNSFLELTGNILSKDILRNWKITVEWVERARKHYQNFISAAEYMKIEGLTFDGYSFDIIYDIEDSLDNIHTMLCTVDEALSITGRVIFEGHKKRLCEIDSFIRFITRKYRALLERNETLFRKSDFADIIYEYIEE